MIRTSDVRPLLGAWGLLLLMTGPVSPTHAGPPDSTDFEAGRAAFAVRFGDTHNYTPHHGGHRDAGDDRFNGGLSAYDATSVHGPFVHLDLRGRRVRW